MRCGDVAAAASVVSRGVASELQNVLCHEQVVETLMQRHAVLPLRFGTLAADGDALRALLRRLHPALAGEFARLGGKVEFALRVGGLAEEPSPAIDFSAPVPPGTGYLRAKAQRQQERSARDAAARRIERRLRPHLDPSADEAVWELAARGDVALVASYLVARNGISRFAEAVAGARGRYPELGVTCTGPWAPYSFVTLCADEAWQ